MHVLADYTMCTAQVDQYHEEAGGQRTVVRLGKFSLSFRKKRAKNVEL